MKKITNELEAVRHYISESNTECYTCACGGNPEVIVEPKHWIIIKCQKCGCTVGAAGNDHIEALKTAFRKWDAKHLGSENPIHLIGQSEIFGFELTPDNNENPCVRVFTWEKLYEFPLVTSMQIHVFNEFLRSLDLGIEIEFKGYAQYGELLNECWEMLAMERTITYETSERLRDCS